MGGLGTVVVSSIFGWVRGTGVFAAVVPVLMSVWVLVGRSSSLDHTLAQRIRVMGTRMPNRTYGCEVNSPHNRTCGARAVNV